jgi:hypothetical protein
LNLNNLSLFHRAKSFAISFVFWTSYLHLRGVILCAAQQPVFLLKWSWTKGGIQFRKETFFGGTGI